MSVFFCDSDCELWYDVIDELGIQTIEMPYTVNGEELYYDFGRNTDFDKFYADVRQGATVKTSALNALDYINYFEPHLKNGDDIIYVHFSREMSGTFNSMDKAIEELKEKYPDRNIKTVDTKSICMGAGILVYEAAKLWKNGATDDEIVKWVEDNRDNFATYFLVEDLKYLKAGGRISPAVALIGKALNIKPILKIDKEGKIGKVSTTRGFKQGMKALVETMKDIGENLADHPISIIHADNLENAEYLKQLVIEAIGPEANIWIQPIGPVIGCHAGPGAVGIVYHSKCR